MGEEREKQGGSHAAFTLCVAALVVAPFAYALSFGPACWLGNNGYLSDDFKIVYVPLCFVAMCCPPLKDALQWYLDLWR